jgi:cell division protein FtsB
LPYRLKFRQVSDLTPSKKCAKQPPASVDTLPTPTPALSQPSPSSTVTHTQPTPVPVSIFRKSERNLLEKKSRDEKYIEKLRVDIEKLNKQINSLQEQNVSKISEINELNDEIKNMHVAEEFLEKIAQQSISKINESDEKIKDILQNYDVLLRHMDRLSLENDNLVELNGKLTNSNNEFIKISDEHIRELEHKLEAKTDELHKIKTKLAEKTSLVKNFEFELGQKVMENFELSSKLEKTHENFKIFEVQHEENLKMLKGSYENEIFFLNSQLTKSQNQLTKLAKQQKKLQTIDLESQIDFESQKAKFEIEKKNYDITIKNYQNIIEVLSLRLKKSDSDVEIVMKDNAELKSENMTLRTNYEKLRNSAENLKRNFDDRNHLFEQLLVSSEGEMVAIVSKMNDYFNEKFHEIAELKKSFDLRDKNLKKMTSTILEEYTLGIELARIELDEKQKKLLDCENEIKNIKFENLQLKMKLSEGSGNNNKAATLATIEEETATDDEKKRREEENAQLKLKVCCRRTC